MSKLKTEIAQQASFQSLEEEALLNLLRSADCLDRLVQHKIKPWGITATQYNVLRILRGAHPGGLTCSAIGARMITAEPDITRLLSRLKANKLVRQRRDRHDRRVVWTHISETGLKLLSSMDPMIEHAPGELLGHLSGEELTELVRLLEAARWRCEGGEGKPASNGSAHEPPTCDGTPTRDGTSDKPAPNGTGSAPTCDGKEKKTA